jgi:hypothetical protein
MFQIPYQGVYLNGAFHTHNTTTNAVPANNFMLGVWGSFKESTNYFQHILNETPVPENFILRMDNTPFGTAQQLTQFQYSNPGVGSMNSVHFLKGSAFNPELLMRCTTRVGKICESWTNLPKSDIQDKIQIRFHETFINTDKQLSSLLSYTQQTFSCMRPNQ